MNRKRKTKEILICMLVVIGILLAAINNAKAEDFIFGTAERLGPAVNTDENEWMPRISYDGLSLNFQRNYGVEAKAWIARRITTQDPWEPAVRPEGETVSELISSMGILLGEMTRDGLEFYTWADMHDGYGKSDIYVFTRETINSTWEGPINIGPPVNTEYYEIMPTISPDGLELFFSDYNDGTKGSLPSGGLGGTDLWMTRRSTRDDLWQEPNNLGPLVNSSANDSRLHISSDGLFLFFDSTRPGGYGGSDIYMTRRKSLSDPWEPAVNLGPGVNSQADEYNPGISPDGSTLFFVREHDIWQSSIELIVDLNGDGFFNIDDLVIVIKNWDTNEPSCDIGPTPFGDGIVDKKDLEVFMNYWEQEVNDPTLIAHWPLDDVNGIITREKVANGLAVVHGEPICQPDSGVVNGALEFDGIDDYVSTPFILNPIDGHFSVFAWIKGGLSGQVMLSQDNGLNWLSTDTEGNLMTELKGYRGHDLLSEVVITDGDWHRVGFTWDGVNRILFVDDFIAAIDTQTSMQNSEGGLYIGAGSDFVTGTFFSGLIDDVRIYNRVISP